MWDFILDGLAIAVVSLLAALWVIDDGLGMAVTGLAGCFRTVDGLGMCAFF